jgi:TonB family protein
VSARALIATAALVLAVALPAAALRTAQSGPAVLAGTIYDDTGAVLPGVQIKLQDAQEFKWDTTTDRAGHFEFPPVQPGKYNLEAALPGFRGFRDEFELKTSRDWDRAITLQVGQLSESIHVSSSRIASRQPVPQGPTPVRVGGNIKVPLKLKDVHPVYPESMREAGRSGAVRMEAVIGREGAVLFVRTVGSPVHPDFAASAAEAVRQWQFSPTLLNGKPVEVIMNVTVTFSLSE